MKKEILLLTSFYFHSLKKKKNLKKSDKNKEREMGY